MDGCMMSSFLRPRKAFHLIELLVVLIVIGVLISFAVPGYINFTQRTRDKGAQTNLMVLHAALENYRIDNGQYLSTPCSGAAACNEALHTDLPAEDGWTYNAAGAVDTSTTPAQHTFCAEAVGNGAWHIRQNHSKAYDGACDGGNGTGRCIAEGDNANCEEP